MRKLIRIGLTAGVLSLAGTPGVLAQTRAASRTFLDLDASVQSMAPALDAVGGFLLFGETGTVETSQHVGSGLLVDVRVGHRISRRLSVAFAVSGFRKQSSGVGTAAVPSPILVASPSVVTLQSPGLKRREIGYFPQIVWSLPYAESFHLSVFGGPAFVRLQQNVMTASVDALQNVSVATLNQTGTAIGFDAGVDATHPISRRVGVGVFARYVRGKADLPSATRVRVGGLQAGGGLRFGF
jgi:hypothetical protein